MSNMDMVFKKELPTPSELKQRYPVSKKIDELKRTERQGNREYLFGKR